MAPSISKPQWILCIFLATVILLFFNKVIVFNYFDDVLRVKILRFQVASTLQFVWFIVALFVWWDLSPRFDPNKSNASATKYSKESMMNYKQIWRHFEPQHIAGRRYTLASNIWRVALLIILVSSQCAYSAYTFLNSPNPYTVAMWFFLCYACLVQLFSGIIVDKALTFAVKLCFGASSMIFRFVRNDKMKGIIIATYAFIVVSVGYFNSFLPPEIKKVTLPVKDLPVKMDGMTMTFVSDIHLGPTVGRQRLEQVVHMINYLNSDVVIIGGDLVDGMVNQVGESVEPLEWVKSKYGTYYVTGRTTVKDKAKEGKEWLDIRSAVNFAKSWRLEIGTILRKVEGNHEYYTTDAHNWVERLKSLGVHVLRNTHVNLPPLSDRDGKICLAGVDDPTGGYYRLLDHDMDINRALGSCDQKNPVVLVSHQPKGAKEAMESKHRVDLVLSGHTHGGQMFPLIISAYLVNPYYAGLYSHGDHKYVYVSMGTVYWAMPVRFGTRAEITQIRLVTTA